jgi:hypothetical protein
MDEAMMTQDDMRGETVRKVMHGLQEQRVLATGSISDEEIAKAVALAFDMGWGCRDGCEQDERAMQFGTAMACYQHQLGLATQLSQEVFDRISPDDVEEVDIDRVSRWIDLVEQLVEKLKEDARHYRLAGGE